MNEEEESRRQFLISLIPQVGEVTRIKENIEPRAKGRSVQALTTHSIDPEEREHQARERRTRFEDQLTTLDELDDPLQIYLDYLDWLMDSYSQHHPLITQILKQATDQFKQDSRYPSDPRYLKVWIAYAKQLQEPREVYLFLMQQDIGQSLALFYEAYADHEEQSRRYEEAAEIYRLGIHKNAMPKKRLERNYRLFQARCQVRDQRGTSQRLPESVRQMESLRQTGQRTMLGHKFESHSRVSVPANVYAELEPSTRHRPITTPLSSSSKGFTVYQEDTSDTPSLSSSTQLHITPHTGSRQENKQTTDRYTGTTIPQELTSTVPTARFDIYQDTPTTTSTTSTTTTLKRTRPGLQELASDRLKRKRKEREARFMQHRDDYMKSSNSRGDTEYIMHIKLKEDMCVQEARAHHYQLIPKPKQDAFSRYYQQNRLEKPPPEYTAETLAAMESIGQLFQQSGQNEEEEQDLTWTNPYQHFTPIERKYVNENE